MWEYFVFHSALFSLPRKQNCITYHGLNSNNDNGKPYNINKLKTNDKIETHILSIWNFIIVPCRRETVGA